MNEQPSNFLKFEIQIFFCSLENVAKYNYSNLSFKQLNASKNLFSTFDILLKYEARSLNLKYDARVIHFLPQLSNKCECKHALGLQKNNHP